MLVALARRNILPQIDYLSTVSGGGYLGAFLSSFLSAPPPDSGDGDAAGAPDPPEPPARLRFWARPTAAAPVDAPAASAPRPGDGAPAAVGLGRRDLPFLRVGGEAKALRHIRHNSKYLATGSWWQRVTMIVAQVYGMFVNACGMLVAIGLLVLAERLLRALPWLDPLPAWVASVTYAALVVSVVGALLRLRVRRDANAGADRWVAAAAAVAAAVLGWRVLRAGHAWFATTPLAWGATLNVERGTVLAALGAVPAVAAALSSVFGLRMLTRSGRLLLLLAALAAPLFLLVVYFVLYDWAAGGVPLGTGALARITDRDTRLAIAAVFGAVAAYIALDVNATSPHRHYRGKLADAYLLRPGTSNPTDLVSGADAVPRLSALAGELHRGPYHLINAALNVPGSCDSAMQGRGSDFFLFGPDYCGSPLTGYQPTKEWERADRHLDLATAMAISGAAAAPQMGLATVPALRFWLALLNVRLGYWLRRADKPPTKLAGAPGLRYLGRELLGTMDETSPWLHVSDGGHIENLGVYELLRRRCKFIIAVDGEQDPKMTFQAFTTLQRLAAIDLGVQIDANLEDLRLNDQFVSRSHFRFCRIHYPVGADGSAPAYGYLLYVKLSLTGNEGEFIRRYRRDEPVFPHHSTADQFFSEAQFEAYRSLGEHVGDKLFLSTIAGEFPDPDSVRVVTWFEQLGVNLLEPLPPTV